MPSNDTTSRPQSPEIAHLVRAVDAASKIVKGSPKPETTTTTEDEIPSPPLPTFEEQGNAPE